MLGLSYVKHHVVQTMTLKEIGKHGVNRQYNIKKKPEMQMVITKSL